MRFIPYDIGVSTHSRPKAAAINEDDIQQLEAVSTHSRPKAAAAVNIDDFDRVNVSTHSRPKAAARHRPGAK